jgi:LGFP repeat/PAN domain
MRFLSVLNCFLVYSIAFVGFSVMPSLAFAAEYGPETCKEGYVWREACGPNEHVCVTPATRAQAAQDNDQAGARREPNGGLYGPDTCRQGYVWREACGPQDHVCVPPQTRAQAAQDNSQASSRFQLNPVLWDVLTQHNDQARSGAQLNETILNPSNVNAATFGRLYERSVQGQIIAQPLYVSNQWIPGKGLRNVVYVATRKNWIYAFDADDSDPDPSHGLIWSSPVQVNPAEAVPGMCPETYGPVGVTSTPVIDRASDTLYLVSRMEGGSLWLHALDIATGRAKPGTPGSVRITASLFNSTGDRIDFNESMELNRAALLLHNGAIYVGFGALNCDNRGFRGWVLGYRAPDLQLIGAFATTLSKVIDPEDRPGAGVWHSGNGLVADDEDNIYFATGNGPVDDKPDLSESFVKLHAGPPPFYGLTLAGYYTVSNFKKLNRGDTDLGSGGPILLPGGILVGGGKQGKLYVLNTITMQPTQDPPASGAPPPGGSDGFQAFINTWHDDSKKVICTNVEGARPVQRECYMPRARYEDHETTGPNIHTGPIYWYADPTYALIYGMPEKDYLRAFRYRYYIPVPGSSSVVIPVGTSHVPFATSDVRSPDGMPGSFLSLSANKNANGIIWASVPKYDGQWHNVPGRLIAFDAVTLKELWREDDNIAFAKFTPPTVAGGKVFRPTFADKLIVYGLKSGPSAIPCYTIAQKYQNFTGADGVLRKPTGPESVAGSGRYRRFQGGSISWTPSTCAHEVHGIMINPPHEVVDANTGINGLWTAKLGAESGFLGYPLTDETTTPDGIGRYNHFQGGSIYWTPLTGAHEVHGAIRDEWAKRGWERSTLGYPISDETDEVDSTGRFSLFEHGSIHWTRASGAVTVNDDPNELIGPRQDNIDRPGADIANVALPAADPTMCQQQCADNPRCLSWTYVKAGTRCWLKGSMPRQQAHTCCVSGIRTEVQPLKMSAMEGDVDRPGNDFADFALPNADPRLCQGECADDGSCSAWTYVEGVPPHCWLKNPKPAPKKNSDCCVSGTK